MKKTKRLLSFLLALALILNNFTGITARAEDETPSYKVTIEEAEHGVISFSDTEEKVRELPEGEEVKLNMMADDGYEVSRFMILDAESGELISEKETADDQFSFPMPDYDIIVTGEFRNSNGEIEGNDETNQAIENEETVTSEVDDGFVTQVLVWTEDESIFRESDTIISSYEGMYLLGFETPDEANKAVAYYAEIADFAELNEVITVDDESDAQPISEEAVENLENDEDGLTVLNEIIKENEEVSHDTIALIDTGVNSDAVTGSVSMISGDGTDTNGHGTKMLGYILEENNAASVLSIQAFNESGHAQIADVYAAFAYAIEKKVRIINLSASALKTANSAIIADIVKIAVEEGIVVVGSAGNNGKNVKFFIPGSIEEAYIIGSCDSEGNKIEISNFGDCVDYYVVSESTSEATARFSGKFSTGVDVNEADGVFKKAPAQEEDVKEDDNGYLKERYSIYYPKQVLVKSGDETIFREEDTILSAYGDIYLLEFDSYEKARSAVAYYAKVAEFAEFNDVYETTDANTAASTDAEAKKAIEDLESGTDAFSILSGISGGITDSTGAIAMIDTGCNGSGLYGNISFTGDEGNDGNGHGTAVYNLIKEVYADSRVVSIKVADDRGLAQESDICAAIAYAMESNVGMITLSQSAYATESGSLILKSMISNAVDSGITVVVAAGDKGDNVKYYMPTKMPDVKVIGAVDDKGVVISDSNHGSLVDYNLFASSSSDAMAKYAGLCASGLDDEDSLDFENIYNDEYWNESGTTANDQMFRVADPTWYTNAPGSITVHLDYSKQGTGITSWDNAGTSVLLPMYNSGAPTWFLRGTYLTGSVSGVSLAGFTYQPNMSSVFCTKWNANTPWNEFHGDVTLYKFGFTGSDTEGTIQYAVGGIPVGSQNQQDIGARVYLTFNSTPFFFDMHKRSTSEATDGDSPNTSGIVYNLHHADGTLLAVMQMDSYGNIENIDFRQNSYLGYTNFRQDSFNDHPIIRFDSTESTVPAGTFYVIEDASSSESYYEKDTATKIYNNEMTETYNLFVFDAADTPKPKYGAIQVMKMDQDGNPVGGGTYWLITEEQAQGIQKTYDALTSNLNVSMPGVRYKITSDGKGDGSTYDSSALPQYIENRNNKGLATFRGLSEGTYYILEKKAPNGYQLDKKVYTVEINLDNTDRQHTLIYDDTVAIKALSTNPNPEYVDEYGNLLNEREVVHYWFGSKESLYTGLNQKVANYNEIINNDMISRIRWFVLYGYGDYTDSYTSKRKASNTFSAWSYLKSNPDLGFGDGGGSSDRFKIDESIRHDIFWRMKQIADDYQWRGSRANRYSLTLDEYKALADNSVTGSGTGLAIVKSIDPRTLEIKVKKVCTSNGNSGAIVSDNPNYSLAGATFKLYKNEALSIPVTNKAVDFTTDADGNTTALEVSDYIDFSDASNKTTWYVKEVKASKGYKRKVGATKIEIDETEENVQAFTIQEEPSSQELILELEKSSMSGDVGEQYVLSGARFRLDYYKLNTGSYAHVSDLIEDGKTPTRSWVFVTDGDGKIDFTDSSYKTSGNSLYEVNDVPAYPAGIYVLTEITAPADFQNKGTIKFKGYDNTEISYDNTGTTQTGLYFEILIREDNDNGYKSVIVNEKGTTMSGGTVGTALVPTPLTLEVKEVNNFVGFYVEKWDFDNNAAVPQGDVQDLTTGFYIRNISGIDVWVDYNKNGVKETGETFATNDPIRNPNPSTEDPNMWFTASDGTFTSDTIFESGGLYSIEEAESKMPAGMGIGFDANGSGSAFVIDPSGAANGDIIRADNNAATDNASDYLNNKIYKGKFIIIKADAESKKRVPQGDADFSDLSFTLKLEQKDANNKDQHAIKVYKNADGTNRATADQTVQPGGVVANNIKLTKKTVNGEEYWEYVSPDEWLPYARYTLSENSSDGDDSYIVFPLDEDCVTSSTFSITKDKQLHYFGVEANDKSLNTAIVNAASETIWDGRFENKVRRGHFTFQKVDEDGSTTPQGNGNFKGHYAVYNESANSVVIYNETGSKTVEGKEEEKYVALGTAAGKEIATSTTPSDINKVLEFWTNSKTGKFDILEENALDLLPVGTYRIKELEPPKGYQLISGSDADRGIVFHINSNGKCTFEGNQDSVSNPVLRGGFGLVKNDADDQNNDPQGNGRLNATYRIYNKNDNPVILKDRSGNEIKTLMPLPENSWNTAGYYNAGAEYYYEFSTSDYTYNGVVVHGLYASDPEMLPYGDYHIQEVEASTGYNDYNDEFLDKPREGVWETDLTIGDEFDAEGNNPQAAHERKQAEYHIFATDDVDKNAIKEKAGINANGQATSGGETIDILEKVEGDVMYNPIMRGTFALEKWDADRNNNEPQGNADLSAEFAVINISDSYVYVPYKGTKYPTAKGKVSKDVIQNLSPNTLTGDGPENAVDSNGETATQNGSKAINDFINNTAIDNNGNKVSNAVVFTFKTDKDGRYINNDGKNTLELLPYGTYLIVETKAADGYLNDWSIRSGVNCVEFTISREEEVHVFGGTEFLNLVKSNASLGTTEDLYVHHDTDIVKDPVIRGKLSIQKNDANRPDYKDKNNNYNSRKAQGNATLAEATYDVINKSDKSVIIYKDASGEPTDFAHKASQTVVEPNGVCLTLTTDANGLAETPDRCLPYGHYEIVETKPSDGYLNSTFRNGLNKLEFDITTEGEVVYKEFGDKDEKRALTDAPKKSVTDNYAITYDLSYADKASEEMNTFFEPVIRKGFEFTKNDEETGKNIPLSGTNLAGKYALYNRSASYVWVDTRADGETGAEPILFDNSEGLIKPESTDAQIVAAGLGNKKYEDSECFQKDDLIMTFITDRHTGYFKVPADFLPYGSYEIKEIEPPKGYLMLSDRNPSLSIKFDVTEDGIVIRNTSDGKVTDNALREESAKEIYDFTADTANVKTIVNENNEKEVVRDDKHIYNYAVRTDFYFNKKCDDDAKVMAYIPFKITPLDQDGNPIEEDAHIIFTDSNGYFNSEAEYADHNFNTNLGDKVYENYLAYYEANGKWPDEAGCKTYAETGTVPSADEWFGETMLSIEGLEETGDLYKTHFPFGTWFGLGTNSINNLRLNSAGAFPYGTYKIEELRCAANEGYVLFHNTISFEYDSSARIYRPIEVDPHGWRNGEGASTFDYGTIYNYPEITLETDAYTQTLGNHYADTNTDMTIYDHVQLNDLPKEYLKHEDYEFKLHGQLMYADTPMPEPVLDIEGKPIIGHNAEGDEDIIFKYRANDNIKIMEFDIADIDPAELEGRDLVVFETIYLKKINEVTEEIEWIEIGKEHEKDNTQQQIHFPMIDTLLLGESTDYHLAKAGKGIKLTDTVTFKNVKKNTTYSVFGYLYDTETKDIAKDDNGNEIKVTSIKYKDKEITGKTLKFKPEEEDGELLIEYEFDAENAAGKTYVSMIEFDRGNSVFVMHADPEDKDQTIKFPKIGTTALDEKTRTQMTFAEDGIVIIDEIAYENVFEGDYLTFNGTLMVKTGENEAEPLLINGNPVTATGVVESAPGTSGTCNTVKFTFDGSKFEGGLDALAGKTLVCYETMSIPKGMPEEVKEDTEFVEIAEHKDPADKGQTIYIPKIGTDATDKLTATHMADYGQITVVDRVSYENLVPEMDYFISGQLINKTTGEVVATATKEVTKLEKSKSEAPEDEFVLEFTFDGSKAEGQTFVAYEDCYVVTENGNKIVARHAKIDDENQSVHVPLLKTNAKDAKTNLQMTKAGQAKVLDKVHYENVIPNVSYTITGKLVIVNEDGTAGKFIGKNGNAVDENDENVLIATKTFAPQSDSGDETIEFEFDASQLAGTTLVAYEYLYVTEGMKRVGHHDQIDDKEETIWIPKITTEALDSDTVDHIANGDILVTVNDTVTYENVIPGRYYKITGYLVDKDGNPVTLYTEDEVEQIKKQLAGEDDDDSELEPLYKCKYYEQLRDKNKEIYYHVLLPIIVDTADGTERTIPVGYYREINDKFIECNEDGSPKQNPGEYDSILDKIIQNGNTVSITFLAPESKGSKVLPFSFNGKILKNNKVIAFEELFALKDDGDINKADDFVSVAEHKDINDNNQTVVIPELATLALDAKSETHYVEAEDEVTVIDKVHYENILISDENHKRTYVVTGEMYRKVINEETGEITEEATGITATSEPFEPTETSGDVEIKFTFNGNEYVGGTYVAFEEMTMNGKLVGEHKDIKSPDQTIHVIRISTKATDNDTQVNIAKNGKATILDTVTYEGLVKGETYVMSGKLVDKNGNPLKKEVSAAGALLGESDEYIAEKPFEADGINGTVTLEFEIDVTDMDDTDFVVFEKLYLEDKQIAHHEDVSDEGQTIHVPWIGTTLKGSNTNEHISEYSETAILTDVVEYHKLVPGTYTVRGELYDKNANDGKGESIGVTAEQTFTITEEDCVNGVCEKGFVNIDFTIDTTNENLEGKTLVAYEWLYVNEVEIADHTDISDVEQTVRLPKIKTEAKAEDETHYIEAEGEKIITDYVTYSNLIVGKTYNIKGTLYVKTGENAGEMLLDPDGNPYVAETGDFEITSEEETSGVKEIKFTVKAESLAGKRVVAFEDLYYNGIKVGSHANITDKDQTIYVVKVGTTATDKNTGIHVATNGKTIILDEVSYEGLIPGETYILSGKLMDKETGKPLTKGDDSSDIGTLINGITGKNNEYISETVIVPQESSGKETLKFEIDTTDLGDKSLVVFEKLYFEDKQIAHHEKIDDEGQTVHVPKIGTRLTDKLNKNKDVSVSTKTVLTDTVTYTNLVPGKTYRMEGKLMNKEDGKVIKLVKVTTDRSIDVTSVKSDKTDTEDKTGETKDKTADEVTEGTPTDATGTPTDATDASTDTKSENDDKAEETNEKPATGKTTISLKDNTAYVEFTPTEPNGTININFTVDTTKLYRKHIVAFEKLFYEKNVIAVHEELTDTEQTVFVPDQSRIKTSATDKQTKLHLSSYGDKVIIIDTVTYENLVPGEKYTLKGSLMKKAASKETSEDDKKDTTASEETKKTDKKTETSSDKPVATSEKTFTPKKANGTVDIEFTVNTTVLAGSDLVAFEELYLKKELVAEHKDLEDKEQTVHNAKLKTTATVGGKKEAVQSTKTEIIDRVEYSNLITGQEYIVTGTLMDKVSKKPVEVDGKAVTVEQKIKPTSTSGYIDMKFTFDSTKYTEVVVFEDLYLSRIKVASHSDLEDTNQTVSFSKEVPPPENPPSTPPVKTGESLLKIMLSILATLVLGFVAFVLLKKKRMRFK